MTPHWRFYQSQTAWWLNKIGLLVSRVGCWVRGYHVFFVDYPKRSCAFCGKIKRLSGQWKTWEEGRDEHRQLEREGRGY